MGHEQKYILNSTSVLLLFSLSVKILGLNFIPFYDGMEIACNSSHEDNNSTLWYNIETVWGLNFTCATNLVVPHTGVFACKTENNCSSKNMYDKPCDLHYMFITQSKTDDYKDINTSTIMLNENQTVTLSCEFNRSNSKFVQFWISDNSNYGRQCLYSVALDESYNIDINKHCCVSKTIQERINVWNGSLFIDEVQKHYLNLTNVTASDSGRYLCFIIYQKKMTLVSNITLQVHETNGATPMPDLYIILGTVGGVFIGIMFLVVYFVCVKGKKKGKKYSDSDATELQGDECIPYAISERRDLEDNLDSMYYAVIPSPEKEQAGEKCPKESEVCMFYSVVQVDTTKALK
ncbi:uncharacterized protein LOC128663281 isoform X2 [Bombina bombina]|uniref:uncharacterized protein LOC128663281 isoform X2 n=1 Tax=Bombina bombina TaxID=8345 RepID=UPI00235AD867|nr:uncharacterized protein LOC128663281 isoform X2 [Bombina bombina]